MHACPVIRTLAIAAVTLTLAVSALPASAQIDHVRDPNWTTPRTPNGHPDLQGI